MRITGLTGPERGQSMPSGRKPHSLILFASLGKFAKAQNSILVSPPFSNAPGVPLLRSFPPAWTRREQRLRLMAVRQARWGSTTRSRAKLG